MRKLWDTLMPWLFAMLLAGIIWMQSTNAQAQAPDYFRSETTVHKFTETLYIDRSHKTCVDVKKPHRIRFVTTSIINGYQRPTRINYECVDNAYLKMIDKVFKELQDVKL